MVSTIGAGLATVRYGVHAALCVRWLGDDRPRVSSMVLRECIFTGRALFDEYCDRTVLRSIQQPLGVVVLALTDRRYPCLLPHFTLRHHTPNSVAWTEI